MSGRHRAPDEGDDVIFDIELDTAPAQRRTSAALAATEPVALGTIEAREVEYRRAGRTILDGVSLTAFPGRSVAVMGPSGSGKTSLLALLAGLEQPDAGTVTRDRAARMGLILQSYGLVGVLTAAENVEAPLQAGALGRLSKPEIRDRSAAALAAVGLTDVADHLIEELSGGQQQRVAIARALAVDPAVVFADELTAELDHDWKNRVVSLVLDVARRGGIVVLATHDPELAQRCDYVVRLDDGRIAAAG
jgi:putative ABC transport system ATP-binding protein